MAIHQGACTDQPMSCLGIQQPRQKQTFQSVLFYLCVSSLSSTIHLCFPETLLWSCRSPSQCSSMLILQNQSFDKEGGEGEGCPLLLAIIFLFIFFLFGCRYRASPSLFHDTFLELIVPLCCTNTNASFICTYTPLHVTLP